MMRALATCVLATAALAIAGCFSDHGVVIEVDVGDTGATSVELFLGVTPCTPGDNPAGIDCRTIAPPPAGSPPLRGDIWFRDSPATQRATVHGHRATFQLRSDAPTTIPVMIAVAMVQEADPGAMMHEVATAMLRDVDIPVDTARVVRTTVIAAAPMMPGGPTSPSSADRVMVWNKPQNACVAVEHWESGVMTARSFIVPASDPDCDNIVAQECDPAAFLGTAGAGEAPRADCLSDHGGACQLGSHGCSDGDNGMRGGECAPQLDRTCVPDEFCGCSTVDPACFASRLQSDGTPHVECHFPMDDSLSLCPNDASAMIALDMPFSGRPGCGQPLIGDLALARFATSAEFGGATLTLSSPRDPCHFAVTWTSGTRTVNDSVSLGAIELAGHGGRLVLPLVVYFDRVPLGNCVSAVASTCQPVGMAMDDHMWACAE